MNNTISLKGFVYNIYRIKDLGRVKGHTRQIICANHDRMFAL